MPRPLKRRRVCCLPQSSQFGPTNPPVAVNKEEFVIMTIDEYETIRLIDLEGLNQEECAQWLNVARTTVQKIYMDARRKLAESLVNGKTLRIEGGNYVLCEDLDRPHRGGRCCGRRCGKRMTSNTSKDI